MEKNLDYRRITEKHAPRSKTLAHTAAAFLVGGIICFLGQWLHYLYLYFGIEKEDSFLYVTLTLIVLASLFTALGFFDKIAAFSGAGTIVPVTGFSNAVTSPAIDAGGEGYVLGVGTKIFTVAGPVILYATLAGVLYGFVYFFITIFQ